MKIPLVENLLPFFTFYEKKCQTPTCYSIKILYLINQNVESQEPYLIIEFTILFM